MRQFLCVVMMACSICSYAKGGFLPNDPYFSEQWNLHNEGPFKNKDSKGYISGSDHAHILEACSFLMQAKGISDLDDLAKDIKIAFIDDGFDLKHEELDTKYVAFKNFGSEVVEGNLFSMDPTNFHGTMVTGIAAAKANNGKGIAGACPGCKIIAARMNDKPPSGMSPSIYYEWIFDWVISEKPDVINCSWGPDEGTSEFFQKLMKRLEKEGRDGKGIVIVAASGNSGKNFSGML